MNLQEQIENINLIKDNLLIEFHKVRSLTDELCEPLSIEDQNLQSMPDTSPVKWHRAHTSWFFETFILRKYSNNYKVFNKEYDYLFNSYYQSLGEIHPRPNRGILSRPSSKKIAKYRKYINENVDELIKNAEEKDIKNINELIILGINHEQQHQELLLMDILHAFYKNPLKPKYRKVFKNKNSVVNKLSWVSIPGGIVEIGINSKNHSNFSFDNEGPSHQVLIEPFQLANRPVTNAEWLEFMNDDGYNRPDLWLSDGWEKVRENNWLAPLYWIKDQNNSWNSFTLYGLRPLELNSPVTHLSFYEANAYANWCGKRLPSEYEWEVASNFSKKSGNLLNDNVLTPLILTNDNSLTHMIGSVWEYTASNYSPYPRFFPKNGAIGEYNGKFMANQYVLRGGCCITDKSHIRRTYRNFFYPHQRWMFSGFRLAV